MVSAIGHEEDQPLVDLVADVRASTPTDAAKRVVPDLPTRSAHRSGPGALTCAVRNLVDRESRRVGVLVPSRCWPAVRVMVELRAAEVSALRDRTGRCLDHQLGAAADDLAPWPGCARSPRPRLRLQA